MTQKTRLQQMFVAPEDVEGTAETIDTVQPTADGVLALDPGSTWPVETFDRNTVRGTLSNVAKNIGRSSFGATFGLDVRGSGTISLAPRFNNLMRACGTRLGLATYINLGGTGTALTAAVAGGTVVNGATSGATATVIAHHLIGETFVFVRGIVGVFQTSEDLRVGTTVVGTTDGTAATALNGGTWLPDTVIASNLTTTGAWTGVAVLGEIVTGGTSGAQAIIRGGTLTGTPAAPIQVEMVKGTGNFTGSETITGQTSAATIALNATPAQAQIYNPSLTIRHQVDGRYRQGSGCRGNSVWTFTSGQTARADFNFLGQANDRGDEAVSQSIQYPDALIAIPKFSGLAKAVIDGSFEFAIGQVAFDQGNEFELRPDPNAPGGVISARIGGRAPTVSIDPEMVLEGSYNWLDKLENATTLSLLVSLGTVEANRISLYFPALQLDAHSEGDRGGYRTGESTLMPTEGSAAGDNEYELYMV